MKTHWQLNMIERKRKQNRVRVKATKKMKEVKVTRFTIFYLKQSCIKTTSQGWYSSWWVPKSVESILNSPPAHLIHQNKQIKHMGTKQRGKVEVEGEREREVLRWSSKIELHRQAWCSRSVYKPQEWHIHHITLRVTNAMNKCFWPSLCIYQIQRNNDIQSDLDLIIEKYYLFSESKFKEILEQIALTK